MTRSFQLARYGNLDPGPGYGKTFSFTSDGSMTAAMDGGTIDNTGASGPITITMMDALAGRGIAVMQVSGWPIYLQPSGSDTIHESADSYRALNNTLTLLGCYTETDWTLVFGPESEGFSVTSFGAVGDGVTDDSDAWRRAVAEGGVIDIPTGDYFLGSNVELPHDKGDVTLNPLGVVRVLWPVGANNAITFYAAANVSADVTVSAVADEIAWPVVFAQTVTKITGDFTGFTINDICHIKTNEQWSSTPFYMGEMFEVLYVDPGLTFIYTNRQLFHTYTPGTYATTVRRITSTPKLTIKPGITFVPSDPYTDVTTGDFNFPVWVVGAVRADVDIACRGAYAGGLLHTGCYDSRFRLYISDCHVDYDNDAFGYGVIEQGAAYGNKVWAYGRSCGKLIDSNGVVGSTYASAWPAVGIPQHTNYVEVEALEPHTQAAGAHLSINMTVQSLVVRGGKITAEDTSSPLATNSIAFSFAGVGCVVHHAEVCDVNTLLDFRDQEGIQSEITFNSVNYKAHPNSSTSYGLVRMTTTQTDGGAAQRAIVRILGGTVACHGAYAVRTSITDSTHDNGFTLTLANVTFTDVVGIVSYTTSTAYMQQVNVSLHNCVWNAGADAITVIYASGLDVNSRTSIYGLDIHGDGTNPPAVGRVNSAHTLTIPYGIITANAAAMTWKHASSNGGATVTSVALLTQAGIT